MAVARVVSMASLARLHYEVPRSRAALATRTPRRSVAVRVAHPALVRREIANAFVDKGPSLESGHPRCDEADFRIWRRESDGRAHEDLRWREEPRRSSPPPTTSTFPPPLATRLATKLSFAEARATLALFVPDAPSTEVIEQAVLGLGRHTADWFEQVPAPEGDGDVLVIMIDSKGAPTATDSELSRRHGKRRRRQLPASPRHRGRHRRRRYGKKPRRNKGDKSKNAKMATMVVMFTLKRNGKKLLGPINRKLYASFAPKRHAFEIARRDAIKRGFGPGSGKLVQIVTDGDLDFDSYVTEYFPEAMHTIDVMHVTEKLWTAGECVFREGSEPLREWIDTQKARLYTGQVADIIADLCQRRHHITGPGNKGKRERPLSVIRYLEKRVTKMPYDKLLELDLELGSGAVEGAVKNIIGKRCDHGGMRWIKERVEAIVQLRCIEAKGDWNRFIDFVHDRMRADMLRDGTRLRLQSSTPALPDRAGSSGGSVTWADLHPNHSIR
jgi:hypothetical protein